MKKTLCLALGLLGMALAVGHADGPPPLPELPSDPPSSSQTPLQLPDTQPMPSQVPDASNSDNPTPIAVPAPHHPRKHNRNAEGQTGSATAGPPDRLKELIAEATDSTGFVYDRMTAAQQVGSSYESGDVGLAHIPISYKNAMAWFNYGIRISKQNHGKLFPNEESKFYDALSNLYATLGNLYSNSGSEKNVYIDKSKSIEEFKLSYNVPNVDARRRVFASKNLADLYFSIGDGSKSRHWRKIENNNGDPLSVPDSASHLEAINTKYEQTPPNGDNALTAQEKWCANMQVLRSAARSGDPSAAVIAQQTSDQLFQELRAQVGDMEMMRIRQACP
jgi:hypothetical protein